MSVVEARTTNRKPNILRALERVIGISNRDELLRERTQLAAAHEQAARARTTALEEARAAVEAWHEPERRLKRLAVEAADAVAREGQARAGLEAQLRNSPPAAVRTLQDYTEATRAAVNRQAERSAGLGRVGAALVAATLFVRDVGWRLSDDEAQTRCLALRAEIEASVTALSVPEELE
jgi:hypothetical protein